MIGGYRKTGFAWRIVRVALVAYLGLTAYVFFMQRSMIYYPMKADEESLEEYAQASGLERWEDVAGGLIGWKTRNVDASNILIVFHGNAGHAIHRDMIANVFSGMQNGALWQVHILEYPGYGARGGKPSEENFLEAATGALQSLGTDRDVVLLGESIGCGTACNLAGSAPDSIHALILVTPFDSLVEVASMHYPFLPVRLLLKDRYENIKALENLRDIRVAVIVAGEDRIVGTERGLSLHDQLELPKKLWILEDASHNSIPYGGDDNLWREVSNYVLPKQ